MDPISAEIRMSARGTNTLSLSAMDPPFEHDSCHDNSRHQDRQVPAILPPVVLMSSYIASGARSKSPGHATQPASASTYTSSNLARSRSGSKTPAFPSKRNDFI